MKGTIYEESYDSYGTSYDRVKFDEGSVEDIRDKKIHFILNNQKALELGEKYNRLSAANKYLHYNVRDAFEKMIIESLEKKFKDVKAVDLPKAIPVIVGGKKYMFTGSRHDLITNFSRFAEGEKSIVLTEHPFWGKMNHDDWNKLMWKHMDHHLRQFGV